MLSFQKQSMKYFASILLVSFAWMSLFGLTFFVAMEHSHSSCFLPFMNQTADCPGNALVSALHHIASYNFLFSVVMPVLVYLLILFSLFFAWCHLFRLKVYLVSLPVLFYRRFIPDRIVFSLWRLFSWLSLFEHSPSRLN